MLQVQDSDGVGIGGSSRGGTNGRITDVFWDLLKG